MYDVFDDISRQAALDQALYILRHRAAGNCTLTRGSCTSDEPIFQAKMLANLANYTANGTLFCDHVDQVCHTTMPSSVTHMTSNSDHPLASDTVCDGCQVWLGLSSVYASPAWRDGLAFAPGLVNGYGFTDSIAKSGHRLFESVLHVQVR